MIILNRANPKSFWLAALFSVIILCVFLSLVSVLMLLFSPPDQDDNLTTVNKSENTAYLTKDTEMKVDEARDADTLKKLK